MGSGTMIWTVNAPGPHRGQPVRRAGVPLGEASSAMVLVHGRGATAESILSLASEWPHPGMAYVAPQAADQTWYPNRFLAPLASNEPWLTSALAALDDVMKRLGEARISPERIVLAGFSQGGCLALEYAVRHVRRYGGLAGLSAGLIGPPGTSWTSAGSFDGTPAFLGCSDVDAHIPVERVHETAAVLRDHGADVTAVLYPGMGHTVSDDELQHVREMLRGI